MNIFSIVNINIMLRLIQPILMKKVSLKVTMIVTLSFLMALSTTAIYASPVEIVSSSSYVKYGMTSIVGEVENTGTDNLEYVMITATFYDANENVVDTGFTYARMDIIKPGDKAPFQITSLEDNLNMDHYSLQVSDYRATSSSPYRVFNIKGVTDSVQYGMFTVRGEVENIGTLDTTYVMVVVTYYDGQGTVIDTGFTYATTDTLRAGNKSPFELTNLNDISPASYDVQVQCQENMPTSSITCSVEDTSLIIGDEQTVSGTLSPNREDAEIELVFTDPDDTSIRETVLTDSNGDYSYTYEPDTLGDWSVTALWSGDNTYGGSSSPTREYSINEAPKLGSLEITVNDDSGNPLQGVSVSSTSEPSGQDELSQSTTSSGTATFTDILIGSYSIKLDKTGYESTSSTIQVQEDSTASQSYELQKETCTIIVTVNDSNGNNLNGATVTSTSYPSGQTKLTGTTSNGEISFEDIVPGSYTIEATYSGHTKQSKSVSLNTGDQKTIQLTLPEIQETDTGSSDGGGIPGFPIEAIVLSLVAVYLVLYLKK